MALGRRWRWTTGEKTFEPKTCAPGAVRSGVPRAFPFGCHWAAVTFVVLVRAMTGRLRGPPWRVVVHPDNPSGAPAVHVADPPTGGREEAPELRPRGQRPWLGRPLA